MNIKEINSLRDNVLSNRQAIREPKILLQEESSKITIEGVAITANYIDSHNSIFTEECLRKSVGLDIFHNAEHIRDFSHLINPRVDTEVREFDLKDLGADIEGNALSFVFTSTFEEEDNKKMFKEYSRGRVRYHSIEFDWGAREEILCVRDEDNFKANWDKYYPQVINKEVADRRGWFYVYETAPILGISAVVLGSNRLTPTLSARGYSEEDLTYEKEVKTTFLQRIR